MVDILTEDVRGNRDEVFYFRLTATLTPGGNATADQVIFKEADDEFFDVSGSTTTIYDFHDYDSLGDGNAYGVNYGLSGEVFKCRYARARRRYETIGSQGLNRFGKTDGAVTAGNSATVEVYHSQESPSCTGSDSGVTISACAHVDIPDNTDVECVYHPEFKNWFIASIVQFKPLVRFTLDSALATSDASKAATITDQYGVGKDNSTSITVHNLETDTASTYVFEGSSGDAGLAMWDTGTNYRIIQMQC